MAELAFGPRARGMVTFLIDATVFGAGVPNLLVGESDRTVSSRSQGRTGPVGPTG